ncbi:hypothetical protein [Jannaschia pohangensis]|uniref:EF hand n=1 Tax=Jannaschia pohangensis TaxID=390807 RepID=A0A1I3HZH4_9RHOB|nr:hypothetical protein [Jannaschia pohangensis]SFI41013.1 EF hand [Jannaschia pohangensis]
MKTLLSSAATVLILAAPLWAQDADGDGNVSLEELQAVYPDVTAESYAAMDTDADGTLSAAEIQAAIDAGTLGG